MLKKTVLEKLRSGNKIPKCWEEAIANSSNVEDRKLLAKHGSNLQERTIKLLICDKDIEVKNEIEKAITDTSNIINIEELLYIVINYVNNPINSALLLPNQQILLDITSGAINVKKSLSGQNEIDFEMPLDKFILERHYHIFRSKYKSNLNYDEFLTVVKDEKLLDISCDEYFITSLIIKIIEKVENLSVNTSESLDIEEIEKRMESILHELEDSAEVTEIKKLFE